MNNELVPLDKCLHPVRVKRSDGVHYYRCGKCLSCLHAKQSMWSRKLVHQIESSASTLFITLHYDNHNLPYAVYDTSTRDILCISRTKYQKRLKSFERIYDYDLSYDIKKALDSVSESAPLPHFVRSRLGSVVNFDDSPRLNICLKPDVQDFIKRLRSLLSRLPEVSNLDYSFSYFVCSEYGPKTFRPHYHGLLFFNDKRVAQVVKDGLCFKAWGKTDICSYEKEPMCKFVTRASGAASYVSKYITIGSELPSCFGSTVFRPFYLFSKKTPIGSSAFKVDDIPDMVDSHSVLSHHEFIDKRTSERISYDVPFPSCCWNRVFPKFVFLDLLPASSIYYIFRLLYQFRGRELPNLTSELVDRYNFGAVVFNRDVTVKSRVRWSLKYKYIRGLLNNCPNLHPREIWAFICDDSPLKTEFRFYNYGADRTYSVSVSTFFSELYSDPNFWYLYLFGIPQNRSACRKICAAFDNYEWCSDVLTYADYYIKFSTVNFCVQFGLFNEQRNALLLPSSVEPCVLFYLYPFLYDFFKNGLDSIEPYWLNNIFSLYQIMYNIDFEHFVSSLRRYDYRDSQIFKNYVQNLVFIHNHNISTKLHSHEKCRNF